MEWIHEYIVEKVGSAIVIRGQFNNSAGQFRIEVKGDGGNADTCEITLWDGQFYGDNGYEPHEFTITGAWEIRETIEMFALLGSIIDKK